MWNPLKFALMNIKGQQENMIWELRLLYSLCDNNKINIIYEDENLSLTRLIIVRTTLTKISLMFICLVPFSWFRIPDSRFRIPGSGFRIPDSLFPNPYFPTPKATWTERIFVLRSLGFFSEKLILESYFLLIICYKILSFLCNFYASGL